MLHDELHWLSRLHFAGLNQVTETLKASQSSKHSRQKYQARRSQNQKRFGKKLRYHTYLCHISERIQANYGNLCSKFILNLAVKECISTFGSEFFVLTLLVFGVVPWMPVHWDELPKNGEGFEYFTKSGLKWQHKWTMMSSSSRHMNVCCCIF